MFLRLQQYLLWQDALFHRRMTTVGVGQAATKCVMWIEARMVDHHRAVMMGAGDLQTIAVVHHLATKYCHKKSAIQWRFF